MRFLAWYVLAALGEIAGCFAFWAWLRLDKTPLWIIPGVASLALFATILTRSDAAYAGRAYAAYGGVYILTSMLWLWAIEGIKPNPWDITGGTVTLIGATIILYGSRS